MKQIEIDLASYPSIISPLPPSPPPPSASSNAHASSEFSSHILNFIAFPRALIPEIFNNLTRFA